MRYLLCLLNYWLQFSITAITVDFWQHKICHHLSTTFLKPIGWTMSNVDWNYSTSFLVQTVSHAVGVHRFDFGRSRQHPPSRRRRRRNACLRKRRHQRDGLGPPVPAPFQPTRRRGRASTVFPDSHLPHEPVWPVRRWRPWRRGRSGLASNSVFLQYAFCKNVINSLEG